MKVRNIITNNVFNLPKSEVELLINEHPDLYEKCSKTPKKNAANAIPKYEQNTILPLIWEE